MTKRIVLCADDYGQAPAISAGIIALAEMRRLSAASCMTNTSFWPEHAGWIVPFADKMDLGLHFNLTEGRALSPQFASVYGENLLPWRRLVRLALLQQLDAGAIEAECEAQLDAFVAAMGMLPRFMDGHLHVHQLPVVREAVLKVYTRRLQASNAYLRLACPTWRWNELSNQFKKLAIYALGAVQFKSQLNERAIPYNQHFSGIYPFSKAANYQHIFPKFLNEIDTGMSVETGIQSLIMCHPGLPSKDPQDPIARARHYEYSYFASEQFSEFCQSNSIFLIKF